MATHSTIGEVVSHAKLVLQEDTGVKNVVTLDTFRVCASKVVPDHKADLDIKEIIQGIDHLELSLMSSPTL